MTTNQAKLQELMRDVFMDPSIEIDASSTALDVPGWDSLSHTLLMLEMESAFGVQLDLEWVAQCENVGQLMAHVEAQMLRR